MKPPARHVCSPSIANAKCEDTAMKEKHMSKTENPTADLEALWRHVGEPDRLQGVNAYAMDEGGETFGQTERLPEVGYGAADRSVVGMLHAIVERHVVRLGGGAHTDAVGE